MNLNIRPSVFVLVWIPLSLTVYFPSYFYPYSRSSSLILAVSIVVLTSLIAFIFSRLLENKYRVKTFVLHNEKIHKQLVLLVIVYIAIFDIIGFSFVKVNVFDSKRFLDSVNYIKFPINFKVYSGLVLGMMKNKWSRLFLFHLIVSVAFSLLFAERLHLMEFLFAFFAGRILSRNIKISLRKISIISVGLIGLFMLFEFSRNFYVIYIQRGKTISVEDAFYNLFERLMSYYGDTINKFAVVIQYYDSVDFRPFHYLFWTYNQLTKLNNWWPGISIGDLADSMGYSYENLTNIGGFALFFSDFGYFSVIIFIIVGSLPSYLFLKARATNSLVYSVLFFVSLVNVLEFPRLIYMTNLRGYYPVVFVLLIVSTRFFKLND